MKKVLLNFIGILFAFCFTQANAQTQSQKKEIPPHPVLTKQNTVHEKRSINAPNAYPTLKIDENDQYMGRESEFLNIMTVTTMPEDFPKYNKSMGMATYNNTVDYYFKQHPEILKDKWKEKVKHN